MNYQRRRLLAIIGSASVAGVAGCGDMMGDDPEEPGDPDDDQMGPEDDDPEDPEDEDGEPGDGEMVDDDEEPDYDDWFEDVPNYEGTVDFRGEEEVTVEVGAGDNGMEFEPPAIMVEPGTTVVWEWTGEGGQHDVVEEDGEFESELTDEEGHTFDHAFEESGVFKYVCEPHEPQGMKGAVAVEENGEEPEEEEEEEEEEDDVEPEDEEGAEEDPAE